MKPTLHAGGSADLIELDPDHPGFRDRVYRDRRNTIAQIALSYRSGSSIPEAPYTKEEHGVWNTIWTQLEPLHQQLVTKEILELQQFLPLSHTEIPQLNSLNHQLQSAAGFRFEPVAGLVTARTFMRYLGKRVFLSTQYIRHHSRPLYTPEPDVVHELIGHAATLVHPGIAEVNRLLGDAADVATEEEMERIGSMYWYTMEFGLVRENDDIKAFGAGLLSSCGELEGFSKRARIHKWDLETIAQTPFDPTTFQTDLFVAPSFTQLLVDVSRWVRNGDWRS
ncbi:MAG: phenylalanine 4-monooxygenase [Deltaproteobacteria bacterium]|nr:phenylalanine 4-monooxygenase [Deltaproteobacteria bacterium]MAY82199.1 phenylalanine 4-monooxygenase [Deltaproteobacteria bacterium]|tara:strand:+ start:133 stop:972 length:840 start_codon:yes stop_codon:yes gene_type:complete